MTAKGSGKYAKARRAVLLIVFCSIVVGLFVRCGWGTLSSLGLTDVAYVCPLGALETLVAGRTVVPRLLLSLLCVLLAAGLLGRTFCAWVCPVPPIRRFFHPKEAAGAKKAPAGRDGGEEDAPAAGAEDGAEEGPAAEAEVAPAPAAEAELQAVPAAEPCAEGCAQCAGGCALAPRGGQRDGLQIDSRHGVLLGALVSSAVCGFPVFCLVCPVGLTIALVIGLYSAIFEQSPTVSLLVFALIILVEVVFFRKWCHKICPMGALMGLLGAKAPLAKPRVDAGACLREKGIDCRVCVNSCPELLDPHSKSIPECTRCGACADACPAHAIKLGIRAPKGTEEKAIEEGAMQ